MALDDTDGPDGGCTTHTALELAHRMGWRLRGMPRLVRLNPNCPHKTRGNGAVVLDVGDGTGPRVQVGSWQEAPLWAYPDSGEALLPFGRAWDAVQEVAEPDADPGLVMGEPLPAVLYRQAVTTVVEPEDVHALLDASGAKWAGGRGVLGAAAAMAWPGPATSHELIAYRTAQRRGTKRDVRADPLRATQTFHTFDGDDIACVPASPCPVLLGLRAVEPEPLVDAVAAVRLATDEPLDGWCVFTTNQASGDHVLDAPGFVGPAWATLRMRATVVAAPVIGRGGHASVLLEDGDGKRATAWAFEPTGDFRHGVMSLRAGDVVEATGAFEDGLKLESLRLLDAVPERIAPPCCGKSMKSMGRAGGFRCVVCRTKADGTTEARATGAWEAPVRARRHLHRPLDFSPQ